MNIDIMNMISNTSISGYYDPSLEIVVVWFHNIDDKKKDLVAYLKGDMKWDLRKVIEEKSMLYDNSETIEIKHERLGLFDKDSKFDITVRKVLNQTMDYTLEGDDVSKSKSSKIKIMKTILDNNSYDGLENI